MPLQHDALVSDAFDEPVRPGPVRLLGQRGEANAFRVRAGEHHELRQLGEQRRERPLGHDEGGSSVGRLDVIDHLELSADRRRAGGVEEFLDRESDAGGIERLAVVERHARTETEDPRVVISPLPQLGKAGHEPSVRIVRHQGIVDVTVGTRLDETGLQEGVKTGWVGALCHDQPARERHSSRPTFGSGQAGLQGRQGDARTETRKEASARQVRRHCRSPRAV
jgi:hypothetical protein